MSPCLFCAKTSGRASTEHAVPKWSRDCLGVDGSLTVLVTEPGEPTRPVHQIPHLNVTLSDVICETCNNEYLGRLENAVKPILSPMIYSAQTTTLDLTQQTLLATWAVKTSWLVGLASRQHWWRHFDPDSYIATPHEYAWLFAHSTPPPRSRVWLACWDARQRGPMMYEPSQAPLPTADGCSVVGNLTTFSLGFVAFQVFSVDYLAADQHDADPWRATVPASLDAGLLRMWPQPSYANIVWPGHAFANDDWQKLVTWRGELRPTAPSA